MSQKSFLDNKKSRKNFPYVGRGGGVSTNIWKIPYVSSFLFLKASLTTKTMKIVAVSLLLSLLSVPCMLVLSFTYVIISGSRDNFHPKVFLLVHNLHPKVLDVGWILGDFFPSSHLDLFFCSTVSVLS